MSQSPVPGSGPKHIPEFPPTIFPGDPSPGAGALLWDPAFPGSPRPSPQVVDYYKEACRALENSETASLLGKIQKDWKKLVQMKIYYFAAVAHVSGGNWGALPVLPSHLEMLLPALEQL